MKRSTPAAAAATAASAGVPTTPTPLASSASEITTPRKPSRPRSSPSTMVDEVSAKPGERAGYAALGHHDQLGTGTDPGPEGDEVDGVDVGRGQVDDAVGVVGVGRRRAQAREVLERGRDAAGAEARPRTP